MESEPIEIQIRKSPSWAFFNAQEFFRYREALYSLIRREFISKYKRTILGPVWFILQPILNSCVFAIVFHRFSGVSTAGIEPGLFYFCALLPWAYCLGAAETIASSLITNAYLLEKIYFPRIYIPLSILVSHFFSFGIQAAVFLVYFIYVKGFTLAGDSIHPGPALFALPVLMGIASATSIGVGLWFAALTVSFRDLQYLRDFLFRLWLFLTPVVYPATLVPSQWSWLMDLNPLFCVVEGFRHAFFGTPMMGVGHVAANILVSVLLLLSGILVFNRTQRTFIDSI